MGIPILFNDQATITEVRVTPVPIDKSIPPVIITNVVPIASNPITAVESKIPVIFDQVAKAELAKVKKIKITTKLAKANDCSARCRMLTISALSFNLAIYLFLICIWLHIA